MDVEALKETLRENKKDLDYYYYLKEKSKHLINELERKDCDYCKTQHRKLSCTKLHSIPIIQQIVFKHLHTEKVGRPEKYRRKKMGKRRFKTRPISIGRHGNSVSGEFNQFD